MDNARTPPARPVEVRVRRQRRYAGSVFSTGMRALDAASAVKLLVELDQLDMAVVMDGGIEVTDHSRRCLCIIVRSGDRGWVIKQGTNAETLPSVNNEAALYGLFSRPGIHPRTPRLVHGDQSRGVVVVDFVKGSSLLASGAAGDKDQRRRVGAALGAAIASIHSYRGSEDDLPVVSPPPILRFAEPTLDVLEYHSGASLELIRMVQTRDGLNDALRDLATAWSPVARIHNDLRSDNVIVEDGTGDLVVIDWEMAGLGDPLWDLAGPLAEQVAWWLDDPEAWTAPARAGDGGGSDGAMEALSRVHAFAYAFIDSYVAGMRENKPHAAPVRIADLMRWCAARLIQAAFESTYRSPVVTATARQLLQVALNMYQRPDRAAGIFLGLEEVAA